MSMKRHIVLGVHITDRVKHVPDVQKVFTQYGCYIRTRLGLHEASDEFCSPNGLLILEMLDNEDAVRRLEKDLGAIHGIEVKRMVFDHP